MKVFFGVLFVVIGGACSLDESAVVAVRQWRAHREYAGAKIRVPVRFAMGG